MRNEPGHEDTVRWRMWTVGLVAASGALLVGCGGGTAPASDGATTTEWDPGPTSTVGAPDCPPPQDTDPRITEGVPLCELPDSYFARDADPDDRIALLADLARESGQPEAADALADGELTVAERRQAYQDALDGMVEQGMTVAQLAEYEGLYGTELTFVVGYGSLTEHESGAVTSNCEGRYTITMVLAQEILHGGRFSDRAKEILQECMAEHGVTDDIGDTMSELQEVSPSEEATTECTDRADDKPPPPASLAAPGG